MIFIGKTNRGQTGKNGLEHLRCIVMRNIRTLNCNILQLQLSIQGFHAVLKWGYVEFLNSNDPLAMKQSIPRQKAVNAYLLDVFNL